MASIFNTILSLSGVLAYAVVGALAFLESALFIGLVLPGETALLLGGVLASQGRVSLPVLLGVAVVAAVLGDSVGYEVGRRSGPALKAGRLGRKIGDQRWARAEAYVSKRGGSAVFFGRWVGLLRALVPAVAGMVRMPYRRFLAYNVAGGALWSVAVVLLGYFAGASFKRVETYLGRASLLLLGVVVALAAGAVTTRYVARHRDRVIALTARLSRAVPVRSLARAADEAMGWVSTRAGEVPAVSAGLAAALATMTGLTLAFAQLFDNVLDGGGVAALDRPVLAWLAAHRDDEVTVAMQTLTTIGGPIVLPVLALLGAAMLRWRTRSWEPVIFVAVTAAGSATITLAGKHLVGRARPVMQNALGGEGGFSFPSGHSLNAMAVLGVLAFLTAGSTRSWARRVWVSAFTVLTVALIGLSRLYLGVHWLTDVLAAWLLGGMWLIAVLGVRHYLNRGHHPRAPRHKRPEPGELAGGVSKPTGHRRCPERVAEPSRTNK